MPDLWPEHFECIIEFELNTQFFEWKFMDGKVLRYKKFIDIKIHRWKILQSFVVPIANDKTYGNK